MAQVLAEGRNAVSAKLVRNPLMNRNTPYRAGADSPNKIVAIARQTFGYVVAIAPSSLSYPPPAQP
jgi:hypothetical protein